MAGTSERRSRRPSRCTTPSSTSTETCPGADREVVGEHARDLGLDVVVLAQEFGQQVHARHDAYDAAVVDDREPLHAPLTHLAGRVGDRRLRTDRDRRRRHEIAGHERLGLPALLAPDVSLEEVRLHHRRVLAQDQVGLRNDADDDPVGIDDRKRAHPVVPHRPDDLLAPSRARHHHHGPGHHIGNGACQRRHLLAEPQGPTMHEPPHNHGRSAPPSGPGSDAPGRAGRTGPVARLGVVSDRDILRTTSPPGDGDRSSMLIEAGLALASELDLDAVLDRIVELAVAITGARYGALGVLGEDSPTSSDSSRRGSPTTSERRSVTRRWATASSVC